MRRLLLALVLMFAVGCASTSGGGGGNGLSFPWNIVGSITDAIGIPWVHWGLTALLGTGAATAEIHRRRWKGAAKTTREAIDEFKATPEGGKVWKPLKKKLVEKHGPKISKLIDSLAPKG